MLTSQPQPVHEAESLHENKDISALHTPHLNIVRHDSIEVQRALQHSPPSEKQHQLIETAAHCISPKEGNLSDVSSGSKCSGNKRRSSGTNVDEATKRRLQSYIVEKDSSSAKYSVSQNGCRLENLDSTTYTFDVENRLEILEPGKTIFSPHQVSNQPKDISIFEPSFGAYPDQYSMQRTEVAPVQYSNIFMPASRPQTPSTNFYPVQNYLTEPTTVELRRETFSGNESLNMNPRNQIVDQNQPNTPIPGNNGSPRSPPNPDAPRQQRIRFAGDIYTPLWVRYSGHQKEGYCEQCEEPGRWLQLKNSAFWYHKQFYHGISSITGTYFSKPVDVRVVALKPANNTPTSYNSPDQPTSVLMVEGLCHFCNQWIPLMNQKKRASISSSSSSTTSSFPTTNNVITEFDPLTGLSKDIPQVPSSSALVLPATVGTIPDVVLQDISDIIKAKGMVTMWFRHAHKCHVYHKPKFLPIPEYEENQTQDASHNTPVRRGSSGAKAHQQRSGNTVVRTDSQPVAPGHSQFLSQSNLHTIPQSQQPYERQYLSSQQKPVYQAQSIPSGLLSPDGLPQFSQNNYQPQRNVMNASHNISLQTSMVSPVFSSFSSPHAINNQLSHGEVQQVYFEQQVIQQPYDQINSQSNNHQQMNTSQLSQQQLNSVQMNPQPMNPQYSVVGPMQQSVGYQSQNVYSQQPQPVYHQQQPQPVYQQQQQSYQQSYLSPPYQQNHNMYAPQSCAPTGIIPETSFMQLQGLPMSQQQQYPQQQYRTFVTQASQLSQQTQGYPFSFRAP